MLANATEIIVLQHPRERFHPFGSARMLVASLRRARLEVAFGGSERDLSHPLSLPPGSGLLYPHPEAVVLGELAAADRPRHLVLLDGTWSHANRLYKDNAWLADLPHFAITPQQKSRYLVRAEPAAHCVSTLEAAAEALMVLEPELAGIDALLALFERMNRDQVARAAAFGFDAAAPRFGDGA